VKVRSLIAFTLLTQMAAGAWWVLAVSHKLLVSEAGIAAADQLVRPTLPCLFLLMLVGLAVSMFHLGSIGNAWRACANLRSSWLSREVLSALLFTLGLLTLVILPDDDPSLAIVRSGIAWMNMLFSIGMVWSMAGVYRLRTVPAWNMRMTALSFFMTAAVLGGLCAAMLLSMNTVAAPQPSILRIDILCVGAILLLQVPLLFREQRMRRMPSDAAPVSRPVEAHGRRRYAVLRLALLLVSITVLAAFMALPISSLFSITALIGAFLMALASEFIGRMLFYASRIHERLC
jgi:anaerobic dimethyl sulfoxide reductase subunit C (anchor subunit)